MKRLSPTDSRHDNISPTGEPQGITRVASFARATPRPRALDPKWPVVALCCRKRIRFILCRASFRAGRSLPPFTLGKKPPKITMRSECVRLSSPLAEPALRPGQSDAQRAARGRVPRSRASSKLLTSHSAHFVLVLRTLRHSDRFYQYSRLVDPCAEMFAPFRRLTDCGNKFSMF